MRSTQMTNRFVQWMRRRTAFTLCGFAAILVSNLAWASDLLDLESATHKPAHTIRPEFEGSSRPFHTFALSPERELWLCCSRDVYSSEGRLHITDLQGKLLRSIDTAFIPTAIDFSQQDGRTTAVFIAGHGKLAKLAPTGETILSIDAPNLSNLDEALEKLREKARQQAEMRLESILKQQERVKSQIARIDIAPEEETPDEEKTRLRRLKILQQQEIAIQRIIDSVRSGDAAVSESSIERYKRATSLAVAGDYLFVALPSVGNSGYDVWRLDHDLVDAKIVREQGSGCCGQYDLKTDGRNLIVAENCEFKVALYDTDGQPIRSFGKRSAKEADGFGSCCNPMNVCCDGAEILTAESSVGHIKRFDAQGTLLAYIGTAPLSGGCKHVALAYDRTSDHYFMFNQGRNCVNVLVPKSEATEESEDERAARLAMEGLGKQLLGSWRMQGTETDSDAISDHLISRYGELHFEPQGVLKLKRSEDTSALAAKDFERLKEVAGSEEAAKMLVAPVIKSGWRAIEQTGNTLHIAFVEDNIATYEAHIEFVDTSTLRMKFSFGGFSSPEYTYLRVD